jgi:hypothetical protein
MRNGMWEVADRRPREDAECGDPLEEEAARTPRWAVVPGQQPGQGKGSTVAVTESIARGMGIEGFFRDGKSVPNGFALRLRYTQVSRADRFDRLVLAYLLLIGLLLSAMAAFRPGEWSSVDRHTPCSATPVHRTTRELLARVLKHTAGNQLQAAKILGVTRGSLRTKIRAVCIRIGQAVWSDDDQGD